MLISFHYHSHVLHGSFVDQYTIHKHSRRKSFLKSHENVRKILILKIPTLFIFENKKIFSGKKSLFRNFPALFLLIFQFARVGISKIQIYPILFYKQLHYLSQFYYYCDTPKLIDR